MCHIHLRQSPHNSFECYQSHRVRWERSQKTREKATPVALPTTFSVNSNSRLPPSRESPRSITNPSAQRVRHDALFDYIAGVTRQPEYLGAQPSRPKIHSRCAEARRIVQPPAEQIVAAPPKEEEGPKQQGG